MKTQQCKITDLRTIVQRSLQGQPINVNINHGYDLDFSDYQGDPMDAELLDEYTDKMESLQYAIDKTDELAAKYETKRKVLQDKLRKDKEDYETLKSKYESLINGKEVSNDETKTDETSQN